MNALELKNDIHKYVVETEDLTVLQRVKDLFRELTNENAKLTDLEEKMMNIGLEQADKGLLTPNDEVRAKIDKWIAEKQA